LRGAVFAGVAGMSKTLSLPFLIGAIVIAVAPHAYADELVYTPVNPSFGGNPFNSGHLLGVANAQNDYSAPRQKESQAEQFVRLLQSRLLSAVASQVSDSIFGENAQPTGRIVYDTQTVEWETLIDSIRLTITDSSTGAVTEIIIPNPPPVG
jgi:curli production assembly/transport component CsgF